MGGHRRIPKIEKDAEPPKGILIRGKSPVKEEIGESKKRVSFGARHTQTFDKLGKEKLRKILEDQGKEIPSDL